MDKRTFIKISSTAATGLVLSPIIGSCVSSSPKTNSQLVTFELPNLPYPFEALEPHIDKMTMEIHHGKHHVGYVNNLNKAKAGTSFDSLPIETLLERLHSTSDSSALRNNAGGHYNHSLFWSLMKPNANVSNEPSGKISEAINSSFGSFAKFKETFINTAKGVFGSGWTWLIVKDKKLMITSTPNQDNPLMVNLVHETGKPVLALDVWEHAYYLKYQNRRPDYIEAFFNVINWEEVAKRLV
jgi:Fe-Mn family superoxide dismutase